MLKSRPPFRVILKRFWVSFTVTAADKTLKSPFLTLQKSFLLHVHVLSLYGPKKCELRRGKILLKVFFPETERFSLMFGRYFNQVVSVEYCNLNSCIQERLHFVQTIYRSTVKMISLSWTFWRKTKAYLKGSKIAYTWHSSQVPCLVNIQSYWRSIITNETTFNSHLSISLML